MAASCLTVRNLQAWYTPQQMVLSGLSMELKKTRSGGADRLERRRKDDADQGFVGTFEKLPGR